MKRALVIEPSGNLWGSERALLDLIVSTSEVELAVCCPPERPLNSELARLNIRTAPYYVYGLHEKSRRHRITAAIGVLRACLEFRPDVIYLNQSGSYKVALLAATLLNLPIVAHVRIFEDVAYLAQHHPHPIRVRALIAISAAIEAEIRRFPELEIIPLRRIYDAYVPLPDPCDPVERINTRVACVGRLTPIKGQDILIRAMGVLQGFSPRADCLMVGDGEEHFLRELKLIGANGVVERSIQWLGFISDIVALLRKCSVLVCPSHREPLGRVIFEAWDAGAIPIAFSGSGGAAEIISAADGGILYEQQEPTSLAAALRVALDLNQEQRARLVRNGRAWMARNCSPKTYGEALSAILSDESGPRYGCA